jgi:aspartate racemase
MSSQKPLVGILGGMGPQAGLDLAGKLIALTHAPCEQDHIPFVLFSIPGELPDRSAFLRGDAVANPGYAIAEQLGKMSALGVTIAVIACNTAHASPILDPALKLLRERGVELAVLHLVHETVTHIRDQHPGIRKVGVLGTHGTYRSNLYGQALADAGLLAVLPESVVREEMIHAAIYAPGFGLKTCPGVVTEKARELVISAIRHVREQGAEAVILGCTELPLAIVGEQIDGIPVFDPAAIIARKIILETCPGKLAG